MTNKVLEGLSLATGFFPPPDLLLSRSCLVHSTRRPFLPNSIRPLIYENWSLSINQSNQSNPKQTKLLPFAAHTPIRIRWVFTFLSLQHQKQQTPFECIPRKISQKQSHNLPEKTQIDNWASRLAHREEQTFSKFRVKQLPLHESRTNLYVQLSEIIPKTENEK